MDRAVGRWVAAAALAVLLTAFFWAPLWRGCGLIGGDVYSYYFPQKIAYAESLARAELPLWNDRTGFGYPVLGESQTGALYPPNLVLYRLLDVNAAYTASHLAHYVIAFLGAMAVARSLGMSFGAAAFAALVYAYGWFPARSFLEWAIVGGAWLPWMLWCVERFALTRRPAFPLGLAGLTGLQLLAGHYNLALVSQSVVAAYAVVRMRRDDPLTACVADAGPVADGRGSLERITSRDRKGADPDQRHQSRRASLGRGSLAVLVAVLLGYGLAAVQIVPTWELKRRSQRADAAGFDPAYGHIPPLYWVQTVTPWLWYGGDVDLDRAITGLSPLAVSADTNRVEAHLYFGLAAMGLLVARPLFRRFRIARPDPRLTILGWIGAAALVYTSGWLVPAMKWLPGFGYFIGPGRWGVVTTLAVALTAASTLDGVLRRFGRLARWGVLGLFLATTAAELRFVGQSVSYAVMVERPPLSRRGESPVAKILQSSAVGGNPPRLFAPGPNVPTLTGASCVPVYLGLGPAEYFTPELAIPDESQGIAARVAWLRRAGVTHILSFEPLGEEWPADPIWSGFDPLLNGAWGRYGEPLHLSTLRETRPRAEFVGGAGTVTVRQITPERVVLEATSTAGGLVVLRDLDYPGWGATANGTKAATQRHDGLFRAVEIGPGEVEVVWTYRPASVWIGGTVSAATLIGLIAGGVWTARRECRVKNVG